MPTPSSVKPPPEVGAQRIAGVEVGRGPVLGGMSRDEVAAQQLQGLQVAGQVGIGGSAWKMCPKWRQGFCADGERLHLNASVTGP